MDRAVVSQAQDILSRLNAHIQLTDSSTATQILNASIPVDGHCHYLNGYACLTTADSELVLYCDETIPGVEDLLSIAGALVSALEDKDGARNTIADAYRRILRGDISGPELQAIAAEYHIPHDLRRCVLVFHLLQTDRERAYELLSELTPVDHHDALVQIDRHTVALIKDLTDTETEDELKQYALALQETLISETAHQMTVGIGGQAESLDAVCESYSEAKRAIEVGSIFQQENSVYLYNHLIMERLLLELPPNVSAFYHNLLFNRKNNRLFNEEMLYTIDMFFRKDLNLSDTARQLYIHRNTLVYRLDKVQKMTGLDLRRFDDAVTFKILMELKKCSGTKASRK